MFSKFPLTHGRSSSVRLLRPSLVLSLILFGVKVVKFLIYQNSVADFFTWQQELSGGNTHAGRRGCFSFKQKLKRMETNSSEFVYRG